MKTETTCPYSWQPIETAPTDGSQDIFIAIIRDGEVKQIDFHALIETDCESWEMPQEYSYWASAFGNVEEPTHWAPMPTVLKGTVDEETRYNDHLADRTDAVSY